MELTGWRKWVRNAAAALLSLPALWQLSLELRLYLARFRFPMDLEWLEGPALYQAYRMMHGEATYAPPQAGYLPLFHPPAYPTVLAALGSIFGLDYPLARTVSLLFFLLAIALVARQVWLHHEDRAQGLVAALLAAGCAAAGVPLFLGFSDLVRGDTLALLLCMLSGSLAIDAERWTTRRTVVLALLLTSIVFTRLPAVFFPVWIVLFVLFRNRKAGVRLAVVTTACAGLALVGALFATRGWYWIYTVALNQSHHLLKERFAEFLQRVHGFAPFVAAIPIAAIALAVTRRISARAVFWTGMFVAGLLAAVLPYAKVGGFPNDLMPVPLLVGPAALLLAADGAKALGKWPRVAEALRWSVLAGGAAFLVLRSWSLAPFVPAPATWQRAERLNTMVAELDGDVIIPRAPYLPVRNKRGALQFSDMPYLDAAWAGFGDLALGKYLDRAHAKWAIVAGNEVRYTAGEIAARYQFHSLLKDTIDPVIGERVTLRYLLQWKNVPANAQVLFDFEDPALPGWTRTGDAPFVVTLPGREQMQGAVGSRAVSSYHPKIGDRAKGTLVSPEFTIDRPHMALRVGGGTGKGIRAELWVGKKSVLSATSIFPWAETLVQVVWDVSRFQGQQAQLVLRDDNDGSWAHLLVDHVVVY